MTQRRGRPGAPASRRIDRRGATLDAWFRWVGWGEFGESAPEDVDVHLAGGDRRDEPDGSSIRPIRLTIDVDAAPASAADVYLRLHLLSHRLAAAATRSTSTASSVCSTPSPGPTSARSPSPIVADVALARRARRRVR